MSDESTALVATTTVMTPSGPVTATAAQSPQQRFAALAKAYGAPEQQTPVTTVPAGMHWDPTTKGFVDTLDKSPPKAPLPPKVSDAELRAQGLQFDPNTPSVPADQIDTKALAKLNAIYSAMKPEERKARAADYVRDLQTIYAGRRGDELMNDFEARKAGTSVPAVTATAAPSTFTPQQWEEGHKSVTDDQGYMPLARVNAAGLSGYVLPKLIEGQTVHKSVFVQLADARAAGMTQQQVTDYLTAQMRRDGWIK